MHVRFCALPPGARILDRVTEVLAATQQLAAARGYLPQAQGLTWAMVLFHEAQGKEAQAVAAKVSAGLTLRREMAAARERLAAMALRGPRDVQLHLDWMRQLDDAAQSLKAAGLDPQ